MLNLPRLHISRLATTNRRQSRASCLRIRATVPAYGNSCNTYLFGFNSFNHRQCEQMESQMSQYEDSRIRIVNNAFQPFSSTMITLSVMNLCKHMQPPSSTFLRMLYISRPKKNFIACDNTRDYANEELLFTESQPAPKLRNSCESTLNRKRLSMERMRMLCGMLLVLLLHQPFRNN